jgi:glycine C-acetyltransferase
MAAIDLIEASGEKREILRRNTELFDRLMREAGFDVLPGTHPIRPIMFPGEDGARRATETADHMLEHGVYVIAFSFPVVPRGKARIRVQLSAAHSEDDVRACVDAFVAARDAVG